MEERPLLVWEGRRKVCTLKHKSGLFHGRPGTEEERNCRSCQAGSEVSSALLKVELPKGSPHKALGCVGKPCSQQI